VLEDISLTIPNKKSVAFIGPSGSGKTTLADLILGILTPESGSVFYDGKSIHHNFKQWSRNVGYIPQQVYLLDESILENVAFGIDHPEIDESKVWRALEQAQLADYVRSLPEGLETIVGDRGIRLSGGQRQRVGIARAMYEDPPILVLDEATSSLDSETEKAVMEAVMGFQGNKTMIIVAHRLSTIEHCDIVYKIDEKTIVRER
jgi:ABC-type bacteriocin/lantibiotic exporter with double-glycine peptidase domain